MKLTSIFLFTLLLLSFTAQAKEPINIEGVKVYYEVDRNLYFRGTILEKYCSPLIAYNPQMPYPSTQIYDSIHDFVSIYPKDFVKNNLRGIFLLSNLNCSGNPLGGSYSSRSIYLSIYSYTNRRWLIEALHHEFSSVLVDTYGFSFRKFAAISGYGSYREETENYCLAELVCRQEKDSLFDLGFLNDYARTSHENDFNVYVEYLFNRNARLKELADKYPLVNLKYQMVKKFYNDLGVKI